MFSIDKLRSFPIRVHLDWRTLEDRTAPGDLLFSAWSPFDGMASNTAPTARVADSDFKSETFTASKDAPDAELPAAAPKELPPSRYTQLEFTVDSQKDPGLENIRVNGDRVVANEFKLKQAPSGSGSVTGTATPKTLTAWLGAGSIDTTPKNSDTSSIRVQSNPDQSPSSTDTDNSAARASTSAGVLSSGGTRTLPALKMGDHGNDEASLKTLTISGSTQPQSSYTYYADGQTIALTVRPDRIAVVPADPSDAGRAALLANGGAFEGFTMVRGLEHRGMMIEGPNAAAFLKQPLPTGVIAVAPVFTSAVNNGTDMTVLDEVNVALKPGVDPQTFFNDPRVSSFRRIDCTTDQYVATISTGTGTAALKVAAAFNADPRTEWSEPNFYVNWALDAVPNDPRFTNEWHLRNTGQGGGTVGVDVHAVQAWDVNPGGSSSQIIAVVDAGVQTNHPDLKVWVNPGETPGDGIDNDGNGFIDDVNGWNFVGGNNLSGPTTSTDDHGTAVAGVAAARGNNNLGVVGVSYNAQILSSRIFEGNNVASDAQIASAVNYAAGRNKSGTGLFANVSVENNSWGGYGTPSSTLTSGFKAAASLGRGGLGTVVSTSAGNNAQDAGTHYPSLLMTSIPGLFSTGASTNLDKLASYSNFGSTVDFVTPSGDSAPTGTLNIDTTDRTGANGYDPSDYTGTGANGFNGTSSSSPLAGGIAALVISQSESKGVPLTAGQVRSLLRNNTDFAGGVSYSLTTGKNSEFGYGRLNSFTAVSGVGKAVLDVTSATADILPASTIDFGTVTISTIASNDYRIRNQGTSDLVISNLSVTSGGANFFIQTAPGKTTLKVGESTTFTVGFSPTIAGPLTGTVTIASNDPAAAYVINFTGAGKAPNIGGTVFEDWNGNGIKDSNDPGVAGVSVFLDNNGNGIQDGAKYTTYSNKNSPNGIIPDADAAGNVTQVYDPMILSGHPGAVVAAARVTVNIQHTYDFDLVFAIVPPIPDATNPYVYLVQNVPTDGDNFTNTTFDDNATTPIDSGTAPFTGSFQPITPLSTLIGQPVDGEWDLVLADFYNQDEGVLLDWTLSLDVLTVPPEPSTVTDANGSYVFDNLPAGSTTVRVVTPTDTTGLGASLTGIPLTLVTPNDSFIGNNFAVGFDDRLYGRVYNDANFNGMWDTGELPVAGQTFFLDLNSDGVLNPPPPPFTFVNHTTVNIPDNDPSGISSKIAVAGQNSGTVISAKVTINVTHDSDSDLSFSLVSPSGTTIPLVTNRGLNGSNFTVTVFDDDASVNIADGLAPFTGSFAPESPLSALKGESANGNWYLVGNDNANGNTGALIAWTLSLVVGTLEESSRSLPNGNFYFDLPGGASNAQFLANDLWKPSNPSNGLKVETTTGAPLFDRQWGIKEAIPPTILPNLQVNDGSIQHSKVTSTTLTFSERVTITGPTAATFTVTGPNGTVPFTATVDNSGPSTKVTLTFATPLPDGRYTVTADTTLIQDLAQNTLAAPTTPLTFHRLFGDLTGDATVDGADFVLFGNAFGTTTGNPGFRPEVDYNLDGTIDGADLIALGNSFGRSV